MRYSEEKRTLDINANWPLWEVKCPNCGIVVSAIRNATPPFRMFVLCASCRKEEEKKQKKIEKLEKKIEKIKNS